MVLVLFALLSAVQFQTARAIDCLNVDTTSGPIQGFVNKTTPHVAQFLGIPFTEPPIESRRWLPPSPKAKQNTTIDATRFGLACPQYVTDVKISPNVFTVDVPEFYISPFDYQGEDCLSISIWTPWHDTQLEKKGSRNLPVIIWFYGGGFSQGGTNIDYQNPAPWVERSQKHIVVSIKQVSPSLRTTFKLHQANH